jgi:hypothetical protein
MLASRGILWRGGWVVAERREDLRAADIDRQFVADLLKSALDEGRLSLHEYDERLQETYASRTYGDLDKLLADLPRADKSQVVPLAPQAAARAPQPSGAPAEQRRGMPRWILATWSSWITVTLIVNAIWLASVMSGGGDNYWPIWVMLPWGAVLLAGTLAAVVSGDPHRHVAERNARRQERRQRRGHGHSH